MATPEDLEANAEYIRMADQFIEVPGGTNNNNYANVDLIVEIAVQMLMPFGLGGACFRESFVTRKISCISQKLFYWSSWAMRSLGDKISSTIVAQHAQVPCIPWSGTGVDEVKIDPQTNLVSVADDIYAKGCCTSPEDGLEKPKKLGSQL